MKSVVENKHSSGIIKTAGLVAVFSVAGLFLFSGSAKAVYPVAGRKRFLLAGIFFVCLFFIAGLSFASPAYGATYYVTQAGAGSSSGADIDNPASIATFNAGTLNQTGGDTVYFLDNFTTGIIPNKNGTSASSVVTLRGDYSGRPASVVVSSGSAVYVNSKNYISIINIDGESNDTAASTAGLRISYSANGITVDGGTYKGANRIALIDTSGSVTISNCTFFMEEAHFATGYTSAGIVYFGPTSSSTFSNLTFDSDYSGGAGPVNPTYGIYITGASHTISDVSVKKWQLSSDTNSYNFVLASPGGHTVTNLTMGEANDADASESNDGNNVYSNTQSLNNTFDNVKIYNAKSKGIWVAVGNNNTSVTIRNSLVQNSANAGYLLTANSGYTLTVDMDNNSAIDTVSQGYLFQYSAGTIDSCTYENTTGTAGGFVFQFNNVMTLNNCTVTGNRNSTTGHDGFGVSGSSANITYNNCTAQNVSGDGFSASGASYTCNRCLARNNGNTTQTHWGDGFTGHEVGNITIRNSVAYGNTKSGADFQDLGSDDVAIHTLQNNTFYNNGDGVGEDMGIGFGSAGMSSNDTFVVQNNILANNYGNPILVRGGANISTADWTSNNNLFYETSYAYTWNGTGYNLANWRTNSSGDANSTEGNPLFTTTDASPNLNLQSTSPAIDAGEDVNVTTDYTGNSRYDMPSIANTGSVGSYSIDYTDIGAYEYITPPDPVLTSDTHSSESTWYNAISPVTMIFDSPYNLLANAVTTDFKYLINQTVSPGATAVKNTGTALNDAVTFNAEPSITSDGTWYVHAIAQNENNITEYSDNYDTYTVKYDATSPTGTALSLGTITTSSITATVSGATDADAGLHATPYYFDRDAGTANSGWQAGTTWADTSLTSNTEYTYKVKVRDAATSTNESAFTATQSKYTLTPTPTNLVADTVGQTAITLSVDSINNPTADSSGYYFTNTTNAANSGWIQTDSWQDTGLTCGTSYNYTVKYRNGDGTETDTITIDQATANCPVAEDDDDADDLEISDIEYSSTENSITIKWETNNDADSQVEYGKDPDMDQDEEDDDNEENHKIVLKNLDPDTLYYFKIRSEDENGSKDSSDRKSIRTKKASSAPSFGNSFFSPADSGEGEEDNENQNEEEKDIIDQVNEIPEKIQEKMEETKFFNADVFKKDEKKYLSEVKFQIIDKSGNPIANIPVTLHSDPQTTTTNGEGIATFQNVETGKHTLAFNYNSENRKFAVNIAEPKTESGEVKMETVVIRVTEKQSSWIYYLAGVLAIAVIILIFRLRKNKKLVGK